MKFIKAGLILLFLFQLFACKKTVPEDKSNYVGQWVSADNLEQIYISNNGSAGWSKQEGTQQKSISNGRIKFTESSFVIKGGISKKKFSVELEPVAVSQNNGWMYSGYKFYAKFNGRNFYRIY